MPKTKENIKEIMVMEILRHQVIQFAECSEEQAFEFVITVMDKLEQHKLKIK